LCLRCRRFGEVTGPTRPAPFLDLLRCHLRNTRLELGQATEAAAVDLPHVGQRGQASARRGHLPGVILGLGHDGDRTGVTEDPLDLLKGSSGLGISTPVGVDPVSPRAVVHPKIPATAAMGLPAFAWCAANADARSVSRRTGMPFTPDSGGRHSPAPTPRPD
jgi:hypothetical protein